MNDVVAAAVAKQVQEHPEPEYERRQDAPSPAGRVQRHAGACGNYAHVAVELDPRPALPLAQGQVCDLVALSCQPLGQVPVPALATADGVGKEAVVDDADAHAG